MDLQKILDNAIEAGRAKEMLTSPQLTLGEMVLKLEAVDGELPIVFDKRGYKPTGLGSWRGSYRELAIPYEGGGESCYEQPKPDCKRDEFFGDHAYDCPCGRTNKHSTTLPKNPKAKDLLAVLKLANGKYFQGYRGGDFTMGKTTPIWVANYGTSAGFKSDEKNGKYSQGVVDVVQEKNKVVIKTEALDY